MPPALPHRPRAHPLARPRSAGRGRPALLCALVAAGLAASVSPASLMAQERIPNGRLATLGMTFGLDASDNPRLVEDGESRLDAVARFRLGIVDATPTQRFTAGSGFGLRAASSGTDEGLEFIDPNLELGYVRQGRNAGLTLGASVRRSEVSGLSPLDLILGEVILPEDLQDLLDRRTTTDATRTSFSANATLETRRDAPFGVTYRLGVSGVRYDDDSGTFDDETRVTAGVGLRFDLTETTTATADFGYSLYDDDDDSDRNGTSLNLAISQRRAASSIGGRLGFTDDGAGLRTTAALTGELRRPDGSIGGEIGATRDGSGDLALVGAARASYALPNGNLDFNLSRRVTQVEDDATGEEDDIVLTTLAAGYSQQVTRDWRAGVNTSYVLTEGLDGAGTDSFGQIGLNVSRALTEDWDLTAGVTHRFETDDDGPDASANTVSLSLSRSVRLPF